MFSELTVVRRKASLNAVEMDGGLGMLNTENGRYMVLNSVGAQIWNYTEEPIAVGDMVHKLTDEFDVSYEDCMKNTIPYLKQLKNARLIEIVKL